MPSTRCDDGRTSHSRRRRRVDGAGRAHTPSTRRRRDDGRPSQAYIDKITEIRSDAEFVLFVEKDAAYNRLAEDRFYNQFPCILITGKGQPDVATRMFLSRLKQELKIPVLAFVDSDPYGLKILSVYMSGSKAMSYDSASLTTPDIKWLGLRPSDLDAYALPDQCRLPMTQKDIDMGKQLLKEEFVLKNPAWVRELERMLQTKQKAEIQRCRLSASVRHEGRYLPLASLRQRGVDLESQ